MTDYVKTIYAEGSVRAFAARTNHTVETARGIGQTTPVASAALGRTITATALLAAMLKNDKDAVTVQIKGDGPIGGILVTADATCRIKGYVNNPFVDLPLNNLGKLDVKSSIGRGYLNVIKNLGLKEPYGGQVPLTSGEIAEDFTYYFAQSEQTPSAVALGVLVDRDLTIKQAGGYIIQLMPGCPEEIVSRIEENIQRSGSITSLMENGIQPENIVENILSFMNVKIQETKVVQYFCDCTRERVERALLSMGKKDLEEILNQDKETTINCQFCRKDYFFSQQDLQKLIALGRV